MKDLYERATRARAQGENFINVTPEEYRKIVEESVANEPIRFKPEPPIKSKSQNIFRTLFSYRIDDYVEYDHHAPDYLRQLREWKEYCKQKCNVSRKIYFMGLEVKIIGIDASVENKPTPIPMPSNGTPLKKRGEK